MRIHKVNPYLSIFTFINVAINPYSMSMFIKIYLDINVNDVYSYLFIHICLTRSLKKPLSRTINVNYENCYNCIHSYKVNTYLSILTFINIATVAINAL